MMNINMHKLLIQNGFCAVVGAGLLAVAMQAGANGFKLAGDAQAGAQPYQLHCASCHGTGAAGDGPAARAFNPPPSDLTRSDLEAERLFIATRDGGMAVGLTAIMPAFRHSLSDQEIHDVVAWIKTLNQ